MSEQEIPYPYVFERGDELGRGAHLGGRARAAHFPTPLLAAVGDEIADGTWAIRRARAAAARALRRGAGRLFAAPARPLHRHRLARDPALDPAHQLSPLCRPVRPLGGRRTGARTARSSKLVLPGGVIDRARARRGRPSRRRSRPRPGIASRCRPITSSASDGHGVTLVNIGVGPSNAKNITDHLAVLRPALLADGRPLRRPAAVADHRRLRARARLSAPRPHPRRRSCRPKSRCRPWPKSRSRCRRRPRRSRASGATR